MNKVIQGDCLIKLKELEDNSVDSIVTDPPYGLTSMTKQRTDPIAVNGNDGKGNPFCRKQADKGFMGKQWDGSGIEYNVDMWKECLRVLKPGGHLLAFGGTRTYHRMACAIEDAGFEVRDMVEWIYGSGFPKSLNIGKAIDAKQLCGNSGTRKLRELEQTYGGEGYELKGKNNGILGETRIYDRKVLERQTEEGKQYEGWGTALKPSHEPICMARKPLSEKSVAENVLKWKTGWINIDESRVDTNGEEVVRNFNDFSNQHGNKFGNGEPIKTERSEKTTEGRFPANLIHDGSEEVKECFPESGGGKAKHNSEITRKGIAQDGSSFNTKTCGFDVNKCQGMANFGDSGNASRFFKSILYYPKASKSERNLGCDELEEKQSVGGGGITSPYREDGTIIVSGDKGCAGKYGSVKAVSHNNHPTVKPIALMEYLIKMITPKGGVVCDPFAGSGSTLVAAKKNGYQYIGIELTEEYIPIIEARLSAVKEEKTLFN